MLCADFDAKYDLRPRGISPPRQAAAGGEALDTRRDGNFTVKIGGDDFKDLTAEDARSAKENGALNHDGTAVRRQGPASK